MNSIVNPDMGNNNFHPDWERAYRRGFVQNWPWDVVVSFVFRNAPRDRPRSQVRILELGFGAGANLWFAAREGFSVAGIEGSATAVARARERFRAEGLDGQLDVGDFTAPLAFASDTFDIVIDRASLTCAGVSAVRATIDEVRRVLRPTGSIFFSPYSTEHPAARSGRPIGDRLVDDIMWPGLKSVGPISFWTENDVRDSFGAGWDLFALSNMSRVDHIGDSGAFGAWYAMARKLDLQDDA